MIREATLEDLDTLCVLGRRFFKSANPRGVFTPLSWAESCRQAIEHDKGCALLFEKDGEPQGFIIGYILYPPYDFHYRIAMERAWWCEGGGGLALLEAFELWAKCFNCKEVQMSLLCHANMRPEVVGRVLCGKGYEAAEMGMIKRVS